MASNRCDGRSRSSTPRASTSSGRESRPRADSSACRPIPGVASRYWLDEERRRRARPMPHRGRHRRSPAAAASSPDGLIDSSTTCEGARRRHPRPLARSGRPRSPAARDGARLADRHGAEVRNRRTPRPEAPPVGPDRRLVDPRGGRARRRSIFAMPRTAKSPASRTRHSAAPAGAQPSHGQRMLWYAHQFAPSGAAYHIAGAGRIDAGLDRRRLPSGAPPGRRPARGAPGHLPAVDEGARPPA